MDRVVEIVSARSSLRFHRRDVEGYPEFAVTIRCKGVTVIDHFVHFDKDERERFLSEFARLEQTRSGSATLASGADFRMQITPDGSAGPAWVSFRLHREIYSECGQTGSRSGAITIESGLPLPGEFVAQKLREFYAYFAPNQDA